MMGDRELIDALRAGQNAAWTRMVSLYLKLVHHVVRRTLGAYGRASEQDVEDVAHDLFQSLVSDGYRVLGSIGEPWDLKAWLAISARRRAIDFARKRRLVSVSIEQTAEPAAAEGVDDLRGEYRRAIADSLESLNPKERLVVRLFYLKGLKYRDIAKITGINANSISPTLTRAVEKMQKHLAERKLLNR